MNIRITMEDGFSFVEKYESLDQAVLDNADNDYVTKIEVEIIE
jgi:hypothetical protein